MLDSSTERPYARLLTVTLSNSGGYLCGYASGNLANVATLNTSANFRHIGIGTPPPPPANDELCTGAIAITPSTRMPQPAATRLPAASTYRCYSIYYHTCILPAVQPTDGMMMFGIRSFVANNVNQQVSPYLILHRPAL